MANIPELLDGHVTLEVECLDRLYLNGYIGGLVTPGGLVTFMRVQLGKPIPSPVVLGQVSEKFREAVKAQAERERIPVQSVSAQRAKRRYCQRIPPLKQRGVRDRNRLHWGGAGEGKSVPVARRSTASFGSTGTRPSTSTIIISTLTTTISARCSILQVCSYAPWGIKLCINGYEWAKRQLEKRERLAYEALDNGFLSCAEPEKLQQICDSLGPEQIERLFRKWLKRIPLCRCGRKTGG